MTLAIYHAVTDDSPAGQPWPPPDEALWVMVRRAAGLTLWRSIALAEVRTAATDLQCLKPAATTNRKNEPSLFQLKTKGN
jgi:hypothetical protein